VHVRKLRLRGVGSSLWMFCIPLYIYLAQRIGKLQLPGPAQLPSLRDRHLQYAQGRFIDYYKESGWSEYAAPSQVSSPLFLTKSSGKLARCVSRGRADFGNPSTMSDTRNCRLGSAMNIHVNLRDLTYLSVLISKGEFRWCGCVVGSTRIVSKPEAQHGCDHPPAPAVIHDPFKVTCMHWALLGVLAQHTCMSVCRPPNLQLMR
jgi:hypothetical protein